MIDLKEIRANPERLREIIRLRKVDTSRADLDRWLELDKQKRELQSSLEKLNGEKKKIARLGRTDPDAARSRGQELRQKSRELEAEISQITQEWQEILDWFPNLIHPEMPSAPRNSQWTFIKSLMKSTNGCFRLWSCHIIS